MARLGVRSPGIERIELTEEEADRSGSGARDGFGILLSPGRPLTFPDSVPTISGDCDRLWPVLKGGAGYGALATRVIGDRFWEEEGLDFGDRGLWDAVDPSTRYD